jgi:hypothetical protein
MPEDGRLVAVAVLVGLLAATPVIPEKLQLLDVACLTALPFLARRVAHDRWLTVLTLTLAVLAIGQLVSDEVNGLGFRGSMQFATAIRGAGNCADARVGRLVRHASPTAPSPRSPRHHPTPQRLGCDGLGQHQSVAPSG